MHCACSAKHPSLVRLGKGEEKKKNQRLTAGALKILDLAFCFHTYAQRACFEYVIPPDSFSIKYFFLGCTTRLSKVKYSALLSLPIVSRKWSKALQTSEEVGSHSFIIIAHQTCAGERRRNSASVVLYKGLTPSSLTGCNK